MLERQIVRMEERWVLVIYALCFVIWSDKLSSTSLLSGDENYYDE